MIVQEPDLRRRVPGGIPGVLSKHSGSPFPMARRAVGRGMKADHGPYPQRSSNVTHGVGEQGAMAWSDPTEGEKLWMRSWNV